MSPGKPESEKTSRGNSIFATAVVGALLYVVAALYTQNWVWPIDPSKWWVWVIVAPTLGLGYYQLRNNI